MRLGQSGPQKEKLIVWVKCSLKKNIVNREGNNMNSRRNLLSLFLPSSQLRSFLSRSIPAFSKSLRLFSISCSSLVICSIGMWRDLICTRRNTACVVMSFLKQWPELQLNRWRWTLTCALTPSGLVLFSNGALPFSAKEQAKQNW